MDERHADGHTPEQKTSTRLRRRGLIAGAAALVAGMVAKETAAPVAADTFANVVVNGTGIAIGVDAYTGSAAVFNVGVKSNGKDTGVFGVSYNSTNALSAGGFFQGNHNGVQAMVNHSTAPTNWTNAAVAGYGAGGAGVIGVSGESDANLGVNGYSASFHGVYGNTNGPFTGVGISGSAAGVYGSGANPQGAGVVGDGGAVGVHGECASAQGVGVSGQNTAGFGVTGTSASGGGVYGTSSTGYGVIGYSTGGPASLQGVSTNANIPAFAGGTSATNGLAAHFTGTVYVDCATLGGQFVVNPMAAKSGLLKHPDGTHRLMYSLEAPESWAEDFGEGQLVNGKAEVTLDPDFAALIAGENALIFLTPRGDCRGLFVVSQTAAGFAVHEQQGGTANLTFAWRIVARPRTDRKAERLAKFTIPQVTYPDPATLPKPPSKKP